MLEPTHPEDGGDRRELQDEERPVKEKEGMEDETRQLTFRRSPRQFPVIFCG